MQSIFKSMFVVLVCLTTASSSFSDAVLSDARQPVTFCRPNNMVSAILYIAEAKDFLKLQGIEAKFETTTNAKICQDMLVSRSADYMTGADGPWTYLAASNPPLKILAMLQRNPETSIFARKDSGIKSFQDLKGKKVAYLPGTVSYFFLGRVLQKYGLSKGDLKLTAMQPPTMPAALIGGSIDAFSMWEPWGAQAQAGLEANFINLVDTDLYQYEAFLTGHADALSAHPQVPGKILRALIQAEDFIHTNDQEAFDILSKAIRFDAEAFKRLWPQYSHRLRLEDGPLKLMEDNFRLLKQDDENFKDVPIPNFRSFVDSKFLESVAPERVTLNRNQNENEK